MTATLALALGACGGDGGADVEVFTREDSGISVQVGERFAIELDANPSIGDDWRLVGGVDVGVVELEDQEFTSNEPEAETGGGGVESFVFEAVGTGVTELELFNCYRCLERESPLPEDEPFAETLLFRVTVT